MTTLSTLSYTNTGRVNVSETLRQTALALLREGKREFHAQEIVSRLEEQGYTVTQQKVRSLLTYSGAGYTGKPRKRQFYELEKHDAGMFKFIKYEYDPNADVDNMLRVIEEAEAGA